MAEESIRQRNGGYLHGEAFCLMEYISEDGREVEYIWKGADAATIRRFATKVRVRPDGCWEWTRAIQSQGYGNFYEGGGAAHARYILAHCWSYIHAVGPIPSGLEPDHTCRNRRCVNPDHLELVTHRVNTLRGTAPTAINAAKTVCVHGHDLTGDNIYHWRGHRLCRQCRRHRDRTRGDRHAGIPAR